MVGNLRQDVTKVCFGVKAEGPMSTDKHVDIAVVSGNMKKRRNARGSKPRIKNQFLIGRQIVAGVKEFRYNYFNASARPESF